MPYKPAIEGLDFFRNFSLTTGDGRWLRLHGENSDQGADINLFHVGARLNQPDSGKDLAIWRHATWDGSTPSDQYIKIGFDGGGSPYAHIKTDGLYRGINIESLQVYSESGSFNDMWLAGNAYLNLMASSAVNIHLGIRGATGSKYFAFSQNGNHLILGLQGGDYLDIGGRYVTFSASQGNVNLGESSAYYPPTLNHYVRDWAGEGATWCVSYTYDGWTNHTYQVTRSNAGILAFDIQFPLKATSVTSDAYKGSDVNLYATQFGGRLYFYPDNQTSYYLSIFEQNFNFAGSNSDERGIKFLSYLKPIILASGGNLHCVITDNDASNDLGYERDASHRIRWRNLFLSGYATGGLDSNFAIRLGDALGVTKLSIQDSTLAEVASIDSGGNITTLGMVRSPTGANNILTLQGSVTSTNQSAIYLKANGASDYLKLYYSAARMQLINASGSWEIAAQSSIYFNGTVYSASTMRPTIDDSVDLGDTTLSWRYAILSSGVWIRETGTSPQYYTKFQGGDQAGHITYTLPTSLPAANDRALICSTGGVLSFNDQALKIASSPTFIDLSLTGILRLTGLASDPVSPTDGDIWYRTDLDEYRARANGATYKFVMTGV